MQSKSRDHDSREYYKAQRQHKFISDDLMSKEAMIEDTRKRVKELEVKLADFATAYEVCASKIPRASYMYIESANVKH